MQKNILLCITLCGVVRYDVRFGFSFLKIMCATHSKYVHRSPAITLPFGNNHNSKHRCFAHSAIFVLEEPRVIRWRYIMWPCTLCIASRLAMPVRVHEDDLAMIVSAGARARFRAEEKMQIKCFEYYAERE